MLDKLNWNVQWTLEKFIATNFAEGMPPYSSEIIDGNLLLDDGITEFLTLMVGSGMAFDHTNARIGVGDSSTAADSAQTGLIAATNKAYVGMDDNFPSITNQTISFKATFGTSDANFAWNEWCIDNGTTTLNRKVEARGTKTSNDIWSLTGSITIS